MIRTRIGEAVYARGLNFMGQLGIPNKNESLPYFSQVIGLEGTGVRQLEAHFSQSLALLNDGQILNWGYIFDSLTTARTLSYYKKSPTLFKLWQKYSFFGNTIGMRNFLADPSLLNKNILAATRIKKVSLGGSFVLGLSDAGEVFGLGDNYKGQLGTGDTKYQHKMVPIFSGNTRARIIDIAAGFQHTLMLSDSGICYGCGKASFGQIIPSKKDSIEAEYYPLAREITIPNEKIIKLSAGFHHSLFLTASGNLYASGLNNHGQCGVSNLSERICEKLVKVYVDLDPNEHIVDFSCGKSHNVLVTNNGRVLLFGATNHLQLGKTPDYDLDSCAPTEIKINYDDDAEKAVRVKAGFDRSCVFTDKGNCYIWGGEDLSSLGGDFYKGIVNARQELGIPDAEIVDAGLGFMHTLLLLNRDKSGKIGKKE